MRKLLTVFTVDLIDAHALKASDRCSAKIMSFTIGTHAHPPSILSSCLLPVEILTTLFRMASTSMPETKGVWLGYIRSILVCTSSIAKNQHVKRLTKHFLTASLTLAIFTSLKPLIFSRCLVIAPWTDCDEPIWSAKSFLIDIGLRKDN